MKQMIKKTVAMLVAITLTFSLVQVNNVYAKSGKHSFDNHEIKHGKQKVYGARINRTERKDVKNLDVSIRNLDVTLDAASASVAFEILGAKVNFNLDLYEGNITYGENNQSIIGIPKNASQNYNISCFRIEKYADLVTLMEPNMDLEGKVTLYLGVNKTGSDDVIYLQEELKNIEFDEILNSITNFRSAETNNSYTTEELREIECLYLFGTSATSSMVTGQTANQLESSTNSGLSTSDLDLLESFKNGNYEYTDNSSINTYSSTATYASLYPTISDSIFTSFTSYNKWTHVKDSNQPYSYWQYGYMGTNNPATIIVVFNWIHDYNVTDGLRHSLSIAYNDTVLYINATGELGTVKLVDQLPVTVETATISAKLNDSSSSNCFISIEQGETSKGTSVSFDSVISLILKYYGNSTVYKTWTSWTTIKKWATSSTASKISFYGSPSLQNTYYGGVLNEYTATTDGKLNKVGDCIKFEATTYKYPSATWSYTYTVDQ